MKRIPIEAHPWRIMVVSGIIWILTLMIEFPSSMERTYLELAVRRYPLFPLCYITAVSGTIAMSSFSYIISSLGQSVKPLLYLGKNSLYFLMVHCMDGMWSQYWNSGKQIFKAMKRVGSDVVVFSILMIFLHLIHRLTRKRDER